MSYNLRREKLGDLLKGRHQKYSVRRDKTLGHEVKLASVLDVTKTLSGIPYAIVGGHALALHGHVRNTQDVDLLVNPSDLENAVEALGGENPTPLTIGGMSVTVNGIDVDLVSPQEPWVDRAIMTAQGTSYGPVVSKPFLVLMKLWASRGAQEDLDMSYMLRAMSEEEVAETKDLVQKFLPNDVEDLDSLIDFAQYV